MVKSFSTPAITKFYYALVFSCFVLTIGAVLVYHNVWNECNPIDSSFILETGKCEPIKDLAKWGQTGDFFGGIINPLVGLTTILLILGTLRQNQTALLISKSELEKSSKALEMQGKLMASEHRERAFLRLIEKLATLFGNEKTLKIEDGDESWQVSGTPETAAAHLIGLAEIKDREDSFYEVRDAYRELIHNHIKAQLPYLLALGSIYQSEDDETAKHMLAIQLLASTDRTFLVVTKNFFKLSLSEGSATEKFGVDNIELLSVVVDLLQKASLLYDGRTK